MNRIPLFTAALLFSAVVTPTADAKDFSAQIGAVLNRVILPAYAHFETQSTDFTRRMTDFCTAPDANALADIRSEFGDLALAFTGIEPYRFGPARQGNRFERLQYWPDRKGRGLRQVRMVLSGEPATHTDIAELRGQSVAVQGLLALEFVLFGSESESLASDTGAYDCRYGMAIAGAIAETAKELNTGWQRADGYAALMQSPGIENPIYRSAFEVMREILRSAGEQVQVVKDLKLRPALGDNWERANYKRAPYWRSGLTFTLLSANLEAAEKMIRQAGFEPLLENHARHIPDTFGTKLSMARDIFAAFERIESAMATQDGYQKLRSAASALDQALSLITEELPIALGVTMGFNSLDGD